MWKLWWTKSLFYYFVQTNAEVAVREMLMEIAHKTKQRTGKTTLYGEDYMDDGSKISLKIDIDEALVGTIICAQAL